MKRRERIASGLAAVGVTADDRALDRLERWLDVHGRWSRRINLTGTRSPEVLIDRHLVDCAAIVPALPPGPLADVGSGAGLPGIVVAALQPGRRVYLLESQERRCVFLEQLALELALDSVVVVHGRCQDWQPPERLAGVLARAVAPLPRLLAMTEGLLRPGTPLLAMKGPRWLEEARDLAPAWSVTAVCEYELAEPGSRHVLLRVERKEGR